MLPRSRSSRNLLPAKIGSFSDRSTVMFTRCEMWLSAFLLASNNFGALLRATKKQHLLLLALLSSPGSWLPSQFFLQPQQTVSIKEGQNSLRALGAEKHRRRHVVQLAGEHKLAVLPRRELVRAGRGRAATLRAAEKARHGSMTVAPWLRAVEPVSHIKRSGPSLEVGRPLRRHSLEGGPDRTLNRSQRL